MDHHIRIDICFGSSMSLGAKGLDVVALRRGRTARASLVAKAQQRCKIKREKKATEQIQYDAMMTTSRKER